MRKAPERKAWKNRSQSTRPRPGAERDPGPGRYRKEEIIPGEILDVGSQGITVQNNLRGRIFFI